MKRVLILVEGQTEERFVKDVLVPHFASTSCYIIPTLLTTKVVLNGANFKGGVTHFAKFESDLRKLLGGAGRTTLVTTLLDYYGLPQDFPGMASRPLSVDPFVRIGHLERSLSDHFEDGRFLPFLALHEFEAWVFSCQMTLPDVMAELGKQPEFAHVCNSFDTPERINERPGHNPAARIQSLFPRYRKTLHGPTATGRIGLPLIRACCPHFNAWIGRLEAYSLESL